VENLVRLHALGQTFAVNPLNAKDLLALGMVSVLAILFAETGLLVGFFFPGDSLLFLAGVATSPVADEIVQTHMSLWQLLILAPIAAIAGAQLGHLLGARFGTRLFNRPDTRLFKREYVDRAEFYFNKFGSAKAVVLARFIPIVRTFLNPVAGVLEMPARTFLLWNIVGGLLWTDGILLVGHYLAQSIVKVIPPEQVDAYLLPFVLLIVLVSAIPIFVEIYRSRRDGRRATRSPQ
jgi:membrane-associated protein